MGIPEGPMFTPPIGEEPEPIPGPIPDAPTAKMPVEIP